MLSTITYSVTEWLYMMPRWQSRKVSLIVYISIVNVVLTSVSNCKIYQTVWLSFPFKVHLRNLLKNEKVCSSQNLNKCQSHHIHHNSLNFSSCYNYHKSLNHNFHFNHQTFFTVNSLKDRVQKDLETAHNKNHKRLRLWSGFYKMPPRPLSGARNRLSWNWILWSSLSKLFELSLITPMS